MRDWSLGIGDPLYLTLAADSRLSIPDYLNDHIWELVLGGGEPPALSLRTTFGLRAKSMRIFPRFSENGKTVSSPSDFDQQPTLRRFYPNFSIIDYAPLPNIDVSSEHWVPASNAVSGRVTLTNKSNATRRLRLEVCAVLVPVDGQGMSARQMQMVNVLTGESGGLFPVLYLTGGPAHRSGPHPSLFLDLELGPGATRQLTWTHAATDSLQASFDLARQVAGRPWEAEQARLELLNIGSDDRHPDRRPGVGRGFRLESVRRVRAVIPSDAASAEHLLRLGARTGQRLLPQGRRHRPSLLVERGDAARSVLSSPACCPPHRPRRTR
jgi:hypothetical protein